MAEKLEYKLRADTPAILSPTSLADLYRWYRINLCAKELVDPRGCRVTFLDTDFIHLIKLTNKFRKEPPNRRLALKEIQAGSMPFLPERFDVRRAQELSWARLIVEDPTWIVPNWQPMGRANPGDAYIRDFGVDRPVYRVLICGHSGRKRHAVTIFPRERFSLREVFSMLWP